MFCDAMVTMNSGTATPMIAAGVNSGTMNRGAGHSGPSCTAEPRRLKPMTTMATSSAAGTA